MATHIVGGEMGYTCLGDNQYEIRLTIYRDCFFGNPNAYFDDPASIGVFDVNNILLQEVTIELMGDDTLAPVLTDECLVVPPTVCVHTTTYRTVVELEPRPGGYQLAYQRCCRNETIANIIDPLGTGATYGVTISERALLECNSSAEFLQWPPLYICANEPIIFDQSAVDADGDSVVYRLCTPLQGADPNIPQPQPPNPPPYQEVVWNDPPYNIDNMLNGFPGGQVLEIDPVTGLLTGTPNTVGQFVVGICAEEYRDGELISTTRRDFQYNVGVCGVTNAAVESPDVQCDGLEVAFGNNSEGSDSFLWIFGDPNDPLGTSTEAEPSFTFPDFGTYQVQLIVAPGEVCADTATNEVQLLPLSLMPAFSIDTLSCGDSLVLQINDLSVDDLSEIESWTWLVNGEVYSTDPSPQLTITQAGDYEIELQLVAANGCINQTLSVVSDVTFIQEMLSNDTLLICPGESIFLNPAFIPTYDYLWSPPTGLNDPTVPNPVASPIETTTYDLLLTDPASGCTADRSITVVVTEPLVIDALPDVTTCDESVTLTASSNNGIRYFWSTDPEFMTNVVEVNPYIVSPINEVTYYLEVLNEAGCTERDTVVVNSQAVNLVLSTLDTAVCLGESLQVVATNLDPTDVLVYEWTPVDQIVTGADTANPTVNPAAEGSFYLQLLTVNDFGCEAQDSVLVTAVDETPPEVGLVTTQCAGLHVLFTSEHPAAAVLEWDFGDPLNPNASATGATANYTYPFPGNYTITVSLPDYLSCAASFTFELAVQPKGNITPAFDWSYTDCEAVADIVLTNITQAEGTDIVAQNWIIADTLAGTASTLNLTVNSAEILEVSLITIAENGCQDTITELIEIELISLNLPDELQVCPGESVALNPDGDEGLQYQWSPAEGLSDPTSANPLALPMESTIYSVTVTDQNSICTASGQVFVEVLALPNYSITPDTVTCEQLLLVGVDSPDNLIYEWSTDPEGIDLLGFGPEQLVNASAGSYFYVQMSSGNGCTTLDSVLVDSRRVDIAIEPVSTLCAGDTLQLMASNNTPYPVVDWQWSPSNEILSGQGSNLVMIAPTSATTYNLMATNADGCTGTTNTTVNVFQIQPFLEVFPSSDTLVIGESVMLNATDDPTYSYEWFPATGLDAIDVPNPTATPEETTLYTVRITDLNGCTNTAQVLLVVFDSPCISPYIFLPTAFTPNGDNLNDVLRVEGNVIDELSLVIYNRWGEEVFSTQSPEEGWDGTYKGQPLAADVFGYYLEVRCVGGEVYTERGNVSLLR